MKGENIFRRKDGRWEARYIKGRDFSGRIIYGYCYGESYRDAKLRAEQLRQTDIGAILERSPSGGRPLVFFCESWLEACRQRLKESTCERYETALRKHVIPLLGSRAVKEINAPAVDGFTAALLSEGLSPKTVKDTLTVLRLVLKHASKQVPGLPKPEITYPKEQKKEARVLSPAEQEAFISYLANGLDSCRFGVLLAMFTGLRIGELCALKWKNISLREHTLRVDATMQRLKNDGEGAKTRVVTGSPKSGLSFRIIPLTESAARLCRHMSVGDREAYILTGTRDFLEPRTLQYRIKKYARDCGLEGVHFHTLRHTFATRCVEAGFEIKSLSEILGHATVSVTMERYVHPSLALKRENIAKLAAVGL